MKPIDSAHPLHGRILVADDGRDSQHFLRVILERAGFQVDSAENGFIACQMAEAALATGAPPDLILMDIQMPELDGFESTRRLRRSGWGGPIVALTAHALPEDRERCLRAGFSDYVAKPVDRGALLQVVARHLGHQTPSAPLAKQTPAHVSNLLDDPRIVAADRARIIARFVTRLQDRVDRIEQAVGDVDRRRLLESAHALYGSAGLFGFTQLADAARRVEEQVRSDADSSLLWASAARLITLCRQTAADHAGSQEGNHERHGLHERRRESP